MGQRIVVAVAPVGGWGPGEGNPLRAEDLAREVIAAADEGASVVHIHARSEQGHLTADTATFDDAVRLFRRDSAILLEASTGGLSELSADERAAPASNPEAVMGSLNIGSLNFGDEVYCNSLPDIRRWASLMDSWGVKPSLEIFDTGHLETARQLLDDGIVKAPCNFNFIFDVNWGMPFDPVLLDFLIGRLPEDSRWGVVFVGHQNFNHQVTAAEKGASFVRAGFEDSRIIGGRSMESNAAIVAALVADLRQAGFEPASVEEACGMLLQ